jgi:Protein of unknown function (DUF4239)
VEIGDEVEDVSAVVISLLAFALILLSTGLGLLLRHLLPERHLSGDSKDVIKLATALVGTMSALVIALLFASTRASYEATGSQISHLTANVIELDRLLKDLGQDGAALRQLLRQDVQSLADSIWKSEMAAASNAAMASTEELRVASKLRALVAGDAIQRAVQMRALEVSNTLAQIQLGIYAQPSDSMSRPFVFLLVLWLCFIFATFAMSSAPNPTLICVLFFCALSAASAIYLIIELGQPFDGLMQVQSAPLRHALPSL